MEGPMKTHELQLLPPPARVNVLPCLCAPRSPFNKLYELLVEPEISTSICCLQGSLGKCMSAYHQDSREWTVSNIGCRFEKVKKIEKPMFSVTY